MKATVEIVVGGRNLTFAETRRSKSSRREFSDPSNFRVMNGAEKWRKLREKTSGENRIKFSLYFSSLLRILCLHAHISIYIHVHFPDPKKKLQRKKLLS